MTEPTAPTDHAPRSTAARIGWTILILTTLYVCYFSHLSAIGFVGPDEPRYAWIARDMAESGDWVTPRLYGKPWFEKPVLYYWSAAFFFKLSGVQQIPHGSTNPLPTNPTPRFSAETAARLPSAIYALFATLALAWLALRIYGAETARWLLLLLPTTVGMIGFSHAAATDMPFSATLTSAMVFAAVLLRLVPKFPSSQKQATVISNGTPASLAGVQREISFASSVPPTHSRLAFYSALLLFGFFLGLAVLAKGPAAIILSGGAVFFWALFTKRWRDAFRLLHPVAIVSFCLTALPWYILCARRNPDFFRVFIIEHNFKRYLTPEFQHIQPFWYYAPILLLALVPWVGMTLSSLIWIPRKSFGMRFDDATCFMITWGFFVVLFFSTSHSKLPGYILPAIPAFGFLTAVALAKSLAVPKVPVPAGFAVLALTPLAGIAAFLAGAWTVRTPLLSNAFLNAASLLTVLALTACLTFSLLRRWRLVILCGILGLVTVVESMNLFETPYIDSLVSQRHLSQEIEATKQIPIGQLSLSNASRTERYVLSFYLRREIADWDKDPGREAYVLLNRFDLGCILFTREMSCADLWIKQERTDGYHVLHLIPKNSTDSPSQ